MTSPILLLALIGVLYTAGTYLVLERSLTRVLLGVLILGNATNVLVIVAGGRAGAPPLVGRAPDAAMSDALVQALVLTAIVITLGVTAFMLALIHRTWTLEGAGDVTEDTQDREVRRRLAQKEHDDEDEFDTSGSERVGDTDDQARRGRRRGLPPGHAVNPGSSTIATLIPLPALLPLLGAGATLILSRRPRLQRVVSLAVLAAVVVIAAFLLVAVVRTGPMVVTIGSWPVPAGHHPRGRRALRRDAADLDVGDPRGARLRHRAGHVRPGRGHPDLDLPPDVPRAERGCGERLPVRATCSTSTWGSRSCSWPATCC